jgi:hypothetical protein
VELRAFSAPHPLSSVDAVWNKFHAVHRRPHNGYSPLAVT